MYFVHTVCEDGDVQKVYVPGTLSPSLSIDQLIICRNNIIWGVVIGSVIGCGMQTMIYGTQI